MVPKLKTHEFRTLAEFAYHSLGRPKKVFDRQKLNRMRRKGASLGTLAKEFGISRTHVARLTKTSPV
jgi:hypothetical protein